MQCKLLYGKFNNDSTTAEGVKFIEGMVGGNSPHCAETLKQGLAKGVVLHASCTKPTRPPRLFVPNIITHRGRIRVKDASGSQNMGYICMLSSGHFTLVPQSHNALNVDFNTDSTHHGTSLNINIKVCFDFDSNAEFSQSPFRTMSKVWLSWALVVPATHACDHIVLSTLPSRHATYNFWLISMFDSCMCLMRVASCMAVPLEILVTVNWVTKP